MNGYVNYWYNYIQAYITQGVRNGIEICAYEVTKLNI